jgi:hypothetical protein
LLHCCPAKEHIAFKELFVYPAELSFFRIEARKYPGKLRFPIIVITGLVPVIHGWASVISTEKPVSRHDGLPEQVR